MFVYLLGFAASTALIAYCQNKTKKKFWLFSALALLIPCIIAGLRSETVGTDVQVYVKPMVESAISASGFRAYFADFWFEKWRNLFVADYELGFSLVVFAVARVTRSLPVVLFVIQALTIVPFYAALARTRKSEPLWLGMLVYFFFSYNTSLNLMRQWLAMAFLLLAFRMLLEKRPVLLTVFSLVALLFHYSAIIMVLIYLIYLYIALHRNVKLQIKKFHMSGYLLAVCVLTLVAVLALLNLNPLLRLMSAVGFDRFSNYLVGDELRFLPNQIILRLPLVAIFLVNWKYFRKRGAAAAFYLVMLLLDIVASQLISVDVYSFRIGAYFFLFATLAVPAMYATLESKPRKLITAVCLIGYMLAYWYYTYVMQLRHETIPYHFFFEAGL